MTFRRWVAMWLGIFVMALARARADGGARGWA